MKQIPVLLLSFLMCSCTSKYLIEGTTAMSNLDGKTIFIKMHQEDGTWLTVDSVEIVHGLFTMKGCVDSVMVTTLFLDDQPVMPMVLESGRIKISMAYNELFARGTQFNDLLYDFLDKKENIESKMFELERSETRLILDGKNIDEVKSELARQGAVLTKEMDILIKGFIIDNSENPLGAYVFLLLSTSMPYPMMTPQIEDILKDAPYSLKSNQVIKDFIHKAKENKQLIDEHRRIQ
ncbi:DUF4369 domain-containing protein [Bacteroides sp. OttesenSCG-928-D19]|nr:DUF4369 domain-containing protein [Bacteroides sp. OttesenSCG-928-D19]